MRNTALHSLLILSTVFILGVTTVSAEDVTWSAPQINGTAAGSRTVKVGDSVSATLTVSNLSHRQYDYDLMVGKIEGAYKGDAQSCVDVQNGTGASASDNTYGAHTIAGSTVVPDISESATYPREADTIVRSGLGSNYRLIAFLFRRYNGDPVPTDPCHNTLITTSAIGFTIDSTDPGGSTPPTTVPTPADLGVNTGAFGSGGETSSLTTASGPGTITAVEGLTIQNLQNNPSAALCKALTINLPAGKGVINLSQAGILGICNTRPLLMNLINILTILAGIFFVISVIYSGLMLVQANSDDVAAKAKRNLVWSAIGAVVVILSNWIVPYIIYVLSSSVS